MKLRLSPFQRLASVLLALILVALTVIACGTVTGTNSVNTVQAANSAQTAGITGVPLLDTNGTIIGYFFPELEYRSRVCEGIISVNSFNVIETTGAAISCP